MQPRSLSSIRALVRLGAALSTTVAVTLGPGTSIAMAGAPRAAAATAWRTFHFDAARTGFNPSETTLTPSNVQFLGRKWIGANMGGLVDFSSPAVANGTVYVTDSWKGRLWAFDASCASGGGACSPLWSGAMGGGQYSSESSPAVAGGVVYAGSNDHKLYAFDAGGCGSKHCAPLWTGKTGGAILQSSPLVANGVVYIGSFDDRLYAFPAAGCGAAACSPTWVGITGIRHAGAGGHGLNSPALSGGTIYVGANAGALYAFPAAGCGGRRCDYLWKGITGSAFGASGAAVANGVVYVGVQQGLEAFPAAGCGHTKCDPLWTGQHGSDQFAFGTPAVANGVVYEGIDSYLEAFDTAGCGQATCGPLWIGQADGTQAGILSSAAVANGVVYVGQNSMKVLAFAAGHSSPCGSFLCLPLWQGPTDDSIVSSSPAVVDGVVYVGSGDRFYPDDQAGRLYAFSLSGT
jgi:outer membrane protein assembly factor BamB